MLDAVAGKGFEPEVMMVTLQSLLTGVPYEELPDGELLAMEGEDGPWIVQLSEELRDALADAQPSRLAAIAEQWVRTEEFGGRRPRRLHPEGNGAVPGTAAPAGLADHVHDSVMQVDVGDLEAGQLRQPQLAVQKQHDDRRVPPRREAGHGQVQVASSRRRSSSDSTAVSGSPGGGVLIPAVASRSVSRSAWSQRQKCRIAANHPRAVLLERVCRTSTSQPRTCWRSSSAGPTSGWCSASQPARLRTPFWYALTVLSA